MTGLTGLVAVVDDDDAVRDSLRFLLEIAGYSVASYGSAAQFLHEAPIGELVCLVVDQHMPDQTGLQLVARLRAQGVTLPVALITGSPSADLRPAGARTRRGQGDGKAAGRRRAAGLHRARPRLIATRRKRQYLPVKTSCTDRVRGCHAAARRQPEADMAAQRIGAAALDPRDRARRDDRDRRAAAPCGSSARRRSVCSATPRPRSAATTSGC